MLKEKLQKTTPFIYGITFILILSICSLGFLTPFSTVSIGSASSGTEFNSSVSCLYKAGLNGSITSNILVDRLTDDGDETILVGTSDGLYLISNGVLQRYIPSPFGISHIALVEDVTGDDLRDIVVSLKEADVPALRCYDGATGEKVWHFASKQKVFVKGMGWGEVQLATTGLQIARDRDSQIVIVTSGRCVFALDVHEGSQLWKFEALDRLGHLALVADINGDDVEELAIGSEDGYLYMLSGKSGKVLWKKRIAEELTLEYGGGNTEMVQTGITSIQTLARETGRIITGSGDGKVRLIDLKDKRCVWEKTIVASEDDLPTNLRVFLGVDTTEDGLPEVLVAKDDYECQGDDRSSGGGSIFGGSTSRVPTIQWEEFGEGHQEVQSSGELEQREVTLLDAEGGEELWQRDLYLWSDADPEIASHNGDPVFLEPHKQQVRRIDLSTGDLLDSIAISTLDGEAPRIKVFNDE
ncbi:MAG: PQQ-binding-like beta-propeller repeat protein [Chloroflexota bacterium]|nr:PQQ-binding-like beta-propeller repeat protein [Chloroflexota bacterium]